MTTEEFKASVQYNDWKGTSAADDADQVGPSKWLRDNGHMQDDESLLGINMFTGENLDVHTGTVYVEFLITTPGDFDNIKSMIESSNEPVEVKSKKIDMSLDAFFSLFKRIEIAFSRGGMLEGHEYHYYD